MTRITLDATLRGRLGDLSEPAELCDESGRVVAWILPALDPTRFEAVEVPLSDEERERRRQEPEFTTAEVLARLEKLGCSPSAGSDLPSTS
jgi:hypothetical protein